MENTNIKWYLIQVVSNHEAKVKENLENRQFEEGDDTIKEVLLPLTNHTTKTGRLKKKPMFPGYIFVKVEMTDQAWFIIRNTQYVTGIVGSSGQRTKPTPVQEEQITRIIESVQNDSIEFANLSKGEETNKISDVKFEAGDIVNIKEGDFVNKQGKVISVSIIKQTVTVEVEFFGRMTEIELPISYVQKK